MKFNLSANLGFLFTDVPLAERFKAAAAAGFSAVEMMLPYDLGIDTVKRALQENNLRMELFNVRPGDFAKGERGLACVEGRDEDFTRFIDEAVEYALAFGTPRINCMSGIPVGDVEKAFDVMSERVAYAADIFKKHGLTLLIENINSRDMPGYITSTTEKAFRVINKVKRDNVLLQYDIYHAQRMEGELVAFLRANINRIGHIQVADNPGRHQPGTGEINYPFVFDAIAAAGYTGWIGLEYVPQGTTVESLSWVGSMLGKGVLRA